ncbi:cation:proton antiporter [Cyanobacterium aponinum]|uniref:cation:proton antiporter domain-containing protein n=1 Tax=Cyanobacterium aponinum TaxID=379064 RepID=UPI001F4EBF07|nr:cation:proton antiporter [Cyanobacterium aponinum]
MMNSLVLGFLPSPLSDPVAIFLVMMAVLLIAPLLFEKIKLPGIVGLIIAGIIIGPDGIGLLERDQTIELFGTVGLLFLMFMAGLETSLDDLKSNAGKASIFGFATFIVPMILGTMAFTFLLGYDILPSILVASCFASHTLLSLPIVIKRGIARTSAVTVTLGGTLIVNIAALLVLAVVVKADQGELSLGFWLFLIPALIIYTVTTLWAVPVVGRWFFRRFGHDEGAEFTFVVATLFVVSYCAKLIEIEPIIGAFLAGIGIRPLIPSLSPLMNRIQFIGNTLFVPFFLISVGMLVNPKDIVSNPKSLMVSGVMIVVAIAAKYIPAWGVGKLFQYSFASTMVIFGLSVAQAASTLAAITVAFKIDLVDEATVNGTIAMILATCIVSPWVTNKWADEVKLDSNKEEDKNPNKTTTSEKESLKYRVVVPVANPNTEDNLLNLALILVNATEGKLFPLHVLTDDEKRISTTAKTRQIQLLETAEMIAHATATDVQTIGRIDSSIDQGIIHVYQECQANLIICGWKGFSTYKDNFFGNIIDNVLNKADIPVLITRFTEPIKTTKRVIFAISEAQYYENVFTPAFNLVKVIANELNANLEIIFVSPSRSHKPPMDLQNKLEVAVLELQGNFIRRVLQELQPDDLLILFTTINHNLRGFPAMGSIPEAIARNYRNPSMIVITFPHNKGKG